MQRSHGLPGGLVVRSVDLPARLGRAVAAEFGERSADGPVAGTVRVLSVADGPDSGRPHLLELTGDAGDGQLTGRTEDGVLVQDRHGWFEVRGSAADLEIRVGADIAPWWLIRDIVRPAIQVAGLDAGVAVIHAAAVEIDGSGYLVAGWSESGKTETALALMELGAGLVGDKWTITSAAEAPATAGSRAGRAPEIGAFPMRIGIRSWVVPFLPRLARGLGRGRRARLRGASLIDSLGRGTTRLSAGRPASDLLLAPLGRAGGLAATIRLAPDEVRQMYGQPVLEPTRRLPLGGVIVLSTVGTDQAPTIAPLDASTAARRLAGSAAYERRAYHVLGERAAMHAGIPPIPGFGIIEGETERICRLIEGVPVFELRMPFPTDPRPAAQLIRDVV